MNIDRDGDSSRDYDKIIDFGEGEMGVFRVYLRTSISGNAPERVIFSLIDALNAPKLSSPEL